MNKYNSKVNFGIYQTSSLGSNLLQFYNFKFSEALAFGLGEGFDFRLEKNEEGWDIASYNTNLINDLCANLTFFMNHFVAYTPEELLFQIKENLYVKRYPFLISFRLPKHKLESIFSDNKNSCSGNLESNECFQQVLVYGYDANDESVILNDGIKYFGKVSSHNFLNLFSENRDIAKPIEWKIYIPPRRITKTVFVLRHVLLKISNRMLYLQGGPNSYYGVQGIDKLFGIIKSYDSSSPEHRRLMKNLISQENANGFYRNIFADFLEEAHPRLKNDELLALSESYHRLASLWTELFEELEQVYCESLQGVDSALTEEILNQEILNLKKLQVVSKIDV